MAPLLHSKKVPGSNFEFACSPHACTVYWEINFVLCSVSIRVRAFLSLPCVCVWLGGRVLCVCQFFPFESPVRAHESCSLHFSQNYEPHSADFLLNVNIKWASFGSCLHLLKGDFLFLQHYMSFSWGVFTSNRKDFLIKVSMSSLYDAVCVCEGDFC